jgi:hypothetical protein
VSGFLFAAPDIEPGGRYWVRTSDPCRVKADNRHFEVFLSPAKSLDY